MTRIVYATATTLDGYLADPDDSLAWLFAVEGGDAALAESQEFMGNAPVQVQGSTTYRWVVEHEDLMAHPERWGQIYPDKVTWVFSSRTDLPIPAGADVRVVSGPVADHVEAIIASAGGRDVHVVGGGALAAAFAEIGRLDEVHLSIAPVTLGAGAPLFPAPLDSTRLRLVETHQTGQFIQARYLVG